MLCAIIKCRWNSAGLTNLAAVDGRNFWHVSKLQAIRAEVKALPEALSDVTDVKDDIPSSSSVVPAEAIASVCLGLSLAISLKVWIGLTFSYNIQGTVNWEFWRSNYLNTDMLKY